MRPRAPATRCALPTSTTLASAPTRGTDGTRRSAAPEPIPPRSPTSLRLLLRNVRMLTSEVARLRGAKCSVCPVPRHIERQRKIALLMVRATTLLPLPQRDVVGVSLRGEIGEASACG